MTDAPIKDTQAPGTAGHGVLDGQDLLTQMGLEEQAGTLRTAAERAHGVLEQARARDIARDVLQEAMEAISRREIPSERIYTEAAARLTSNLQHNIDALKKVMHDPAAVQRMLADLEQRMVQGNVPAAGRAVRMADARSMIDFVKTFDQTFPGGIKLEARDMPAILSHFGVMPFLQITPRDGGGRPL